MQRATTETLYFETGLSNPVTMRVHPGEEFEVQTQLNRGPWFDTHPDGARLQKLLRGGNPSSGCIWIEGAEPDMMLSVHIGSITLDPVGFTRFRGQTGAMPAWFDSSGVGPHHRIVHIENNVIHWDEKRRLTAKPMIGFVAVAPAFERIANIWGGTWGGNFDVQEITTGAAVRLRINVPGALLHVGDMHAIQGDGEICGAGGIEASGIVRLRVELSPAPRNLKWPRIVNATHLMVAAMARPCEDAFRHALEGLILWLEEEHGYSRGDAYLWLGQVLEARCTQFVNPTFTYLAKIAREHL
ncbi:MAG TPA: acetamidase/formamidase family protein [Gemmataceae bacterium]|nr:acetamidase/formamidase family protein [Gemmataceae bacterium]